MGLSPFHSPIATRERLGLFDDEHIRQASLTTRLSRHSAEVLQHFYIAAAAAPRFCRL